MANVVVSLMQSLHVSLYCGKHYKNCYLSSPIMQSKQNIEGMSTTCVYEKSFCMVAIPTTDLLLQLAVILSMRCCPGTD